MPLSSKQRQHLKGLGHALEPVVQVGKDGVTDAAVAAVGEALTAHELVKVKLGKSAPVDRHAAAEELAARSASEIVQVVGKVILLFRRNPDEPRIPLP